MNEELFNKLKSFIANQAGVEYDDVIPEAKLEDDLGITGDDAVDLLLAYSKTFNVDVTKFMAADYFDGEGDKILAALIRILTGKKKVKNKVLTVEDLGKGILAGKLDDTVINR
jgi:acyl carrier protein